MGSQLCRVRFARLSDLWRAAGKVGNDVTCRGGLRLAGCVARSRCNVTSQTRNAKRVASFDRPFVPNAVQLEMRCRAAFFFWALRFDDRVPPASKCCLCARDARSEFHLRFKRRAPRALSTPDALLEENASWALGGRGMALRSCWAL